MTAKSAAIAVGDLVVDDEGMLHICISVGFYDEIVKCWYVVRGLVEHRSLPNDWKFIEGALLINASTGVISPKGIDAWNLRRLS